MGVVCICHLHVDRVDCPKIPGKANQGSSHPPHSGADRDRLEEAESGQFLLSEGDESGYYIVMLLIFSQLSARFVSIALIMSNKVN